MTRAPRVLIVGPTPPPFHGVSIFLRDLLNAAPRISEFQFEHLDTSDRRDVSNLGRWDAGNLALGFSNLAELACRLTRERYALVYIPISQNTPAFLRDALFIFQARLYGARVLLHLHGGYFREFYDASPGWFRRIARMALNSASAIAVLSEEFRRIFENLVPSNRIHVVENGVPDLFANNSHPTRNDSPPTILYLSTLARSKGILDLIRALRLLRDDLPDCRLRIAGAWSEKDARVEALAFIDKENLTGCIDFADVVDGTAKRDFLHSGDLFCLPTRYPYEGQPLAVLEAMSAGLPVLATRHGALESTLIDSITGRLLDRSSSPANIAAALREMLADRQKLRAQGQAARARYLDKYTLEHCHQNLIAVFQAALST